MIDEADLMAYADGELDAARGGEVEALIAKDPALAARAQALRDQRARLAGAFGEALSEPVPERLVRAVTASPPPAIDLAAARAARRREPAPAWWTYGAAMAACLVLGVFVGGRLALSPAPAIASRDGQLVAQGPLAEALANQIAAEPRAGERPVRVGLSLITANGVYCRTFRIAGRNADQGPTAGLACREPRAWTVRMAVAVAPEAGQGTYSIAGSSAPAPVMQLVDDLGGGKLLDAAGERAARARGWRPERPKAR